METSYQWPGLSEAKYDRLTDRPWHPTQCVYMGRDFIQLILDLLGMTWPTKHLSNTIFRAFKLTNKLHVGLRQLGFEGLRITPEMLS